MIVDDGKYYLYRHIRLDKNEVFYVGKGTKIFQGKTEKCIYTRAYIKKRNNHWKGITNKTDYRVEILIESNNYEFINQKEIEFINLYKRWVDGGTLTNIETGGSLEQRSTIHIYVFDKNGNCIFSKLSRKEVCEIYNFSMGILEYYITKKVMHKSELIFSKNLLNKEEINNYRTPLKNEKIVEVDKQFNILKIWENSTEISKHYSISKESISKCASGERKSYFGKIFIYKSLYEKQNFFKWKDAVKKEVVILDLNTNMEHFFKSVVEASLFLNCEETYIKTLFNKNRTYKKQFKILKYGNNYY